MKICEFTAHDLEAREQPVAPITKPFCLRTPMEQAMSVLLGALETVNQAGLDGKKLSKITLVTRSDLSRHRDDQMIEIHAKVSHRLQQTAP
jgi:hypothetical protein